MEDFSSRSPRRLMVVATALLVAVSLVVVPARAEASTIPAGFADNVVRQIPEPTAVAATTDGRLLVTSKSGTLHLVDPRTRSDVRALGLLACTGREQGLGGVAPDPQFTTNGFVYLYWSRNAGTRCVNRLARYTLDKSGHLVAGSERVLADGIPSIGEFHNAGAIHMARDGLLYVTVGDGGCSPVDHTKCNGFNDISRRLDYPGGKVFRLTRTGGIPADNPYASAAGSVFCTRPGAPRFGVGPCQETYASGLRNPYRFAYRAATDTFYINDVGQSRREEIDVLQRGADYGWNCFEGSQRNIRAAADCPQSMGAAYTAPLHDYGHDTGCGSVTAAAFVPESGWPWPGQYMFGDYVCGTIFRLQPQAGGGVQAVPFVTGMGADSVVDFAFGPGPGAAPALYYTTFGGGGQLRRITYNGGADRQPTAAVTADRVAGEPPLQVAFDASTSSDPDGDRLTYEWSFGDGGTATTESPRTTHVYTGRGAFTAEVTVRDPAGAMSDPAAVQIAVGDSPPSATLTAPGPSDTFAVGQPLQLRGSGTDAEDGPLHGQALSWQVLLHHNAGTPTSHTHPFASATGDTVSLSAPAPEDLDATTNSYLEVRLTATDSRGQTRTVRRNLLPRRVRVTLTSQPAGLRVRVNGQLLATPATVTSWEGYPLRLDAPNQTASGRRMTLRRWSDGGAAAHDARTPANATTYSAAFWQVRGRATIADRERELSALLGAPQGAVYDVPGGTARNYAKGRLYASAAGVYEVHGLFLDRYLELGGPAGRLGMPRSDVLPVPGGQTSSYAQGDLIWSASTGVHEVRGAVRRKYRAVGAPGGPLGLPTADEAAVGGVAGARVSRFQHGRIYWSGATKAHVVKGAVLTHYLKLRGPGRLGLPVTDEDQVSRGRVSAFTGGRVYWARGTGAFEVHGSILTAYLSADTGGPYGRLGFPLSDERPARSVGRRSDFEGGWITFNAKAGAAVHYRD